jgi:hypothetical protein
MQIFLSEHLLNVGFHKTISREPTMSSQRKTAIVTGASQGIGAGIVHGFVAAAANRWIGVSQAGYACREALSVVLLIFSWPSAVAIFVKW